MGGGPMAALGVSLDNMALQQAASNVQQSLASAQLANQQAALNQQNYGQWTDPLASQWSGLVSTGVRGVDTRSVSSTAASWAGLVGAIAYGVSFLCFAIVIYRVYLR